MIREFKGKSIISLPTDFTIIDIETTGLDYNFCDIIEVAALRVRNGAVVDSFSSLIQPPLTYSYDDDDDEIETSYYVDEFISRLTGITNEMLQDAPRKRDILPQFLEFVGNDILIGHNIGFDVNFIYDAALKLGFKFTNDHINTVRIAKKVEPNQEDYRLSGLAHRLGITNGTNHRALGDCETTFNLYTYLRSCALKQWSEEEFRHLFSKKHSHSLNAKDIVAETNEFDETHPLYKKVVVFTGALASMGRKEAMQLVANLGGENGNSVTKKTNFLVIGSEEFASTVKNGKTSKMKKAEEYQLKGLDITVLSEDTFFDMVNQ